MDLYRFFVTPLSVGSVELPPDQAHHALHVLRLHDGAQVEVFDGAGTWGRGLLRLQKRAARVDVEHLESAPPPAVRLTLATAVPKADRALWLVEQAGQLYVSAIQWLSTDRGVVLPREGGAKMEKFRRLAVESAKQSGRPWLMDLHPIRPLLQVATQSAQRGDIVWCLQPHAPLDLKDQILKIQKPAAITALIGPEGGWSPEESAALAAIPGVAMVKMSLPILRIETACAAVAALVGCF